MSFKTDAMHIVISINNAKKLAISTVRFGKQLIEQYNQQQNYILRENMMIKVSSGWLSSKLYLNYIKWKKKNGKMIIDTAKFDLLFSFKP